MKETLRGNPIYYDGKIWRYVDSGVPAINTRETRTCGVCKKHWTKEGHDPCIGTLPGVKNACCGHGEDEAYVQFDHIDYIHDSNRYRIGGKDALLYIKQAKEKLEHDKEYEPLKDNERAYEDLYKEIA